MYTESQKQSHKRTHALELFFLRHTIYIQTLLTFKDFFSFFPTHTYGSHKSFFIYTHCSHTQEFLSTHHLHTKIFYTHFLLHTCINKNHFLFFMNMTVSANSPFYFRKQFPSKKVRPFLPNT